MPDRCESPVKCFNWKSAHCIAFSCVGTEAREVAYREVGADGPGQTRRRYFHGGYVEVTVTDHLGSAERQSSSIRSNGERGARSLARSDVRKVSRSPDPDGCSCRSDGVVYEERGREKEGSLAVAEAVDEGDLEVALREY